MTLIPAFACNGGFVLHADSEENCGAFRRSVQKIVPQDMGQLRVIVAGSGIGDLIEGFTAKLKERLDADNASDINDVKQLMERRLPHFFNLEVANYPCADEEKLHKFIVAAHSTVDRKFQVWASRNTVLIPVTSYEIAGVEDKLYDYVARQFYRPNMKFSQAILAGLYVLTVAESTSSYVRSPFQTAVIWAGGIETEKDENTKAIVERLKQYENKINDLFLACADIEVGVPEFEDQVDDFKKTASRLHQDHIDQQTARISLEDMLRNVLGDAPLRNLPRRGLFVVRADGYSVEHVREKIREATENFRNVRLMHQAMASKKYLPKIVDCSKCGKKFFAQIEDTGKAYYEQEMPCFHCGIVQKIEWKLPSRAAKNAS
jgi:hypothetical protein